MSQLPPPPPPPPPPGRGQGGQGGQGQRPNGRAPRTGPGLPRWSVWVLLGVLAAVLFLSPLLSSDNSTDLGYSQFLEHVHNGDVESITDNNDTGSISGTFKTGEKFSTSGPLTIPDNDLQTMEENGVKVDFKTPQSSWLGSLIPLLLP